MYVDIYETLNTPHSTLIHVYNVMMLAYIVQHILFIINIIVKAKQATNSRRYGDAKYVQIFIKIYSLSIFVNGGIDGFSTKSMRKRKNQKYPK